MSHKLSDIAKKLGITNAALRDKLADAGFIVGKTASTLTDEMVTAMTGADKPKKASAPKKPAAKVPAVKTPAAKVATKPVAPAAKAPLVKPSATKSAPIPTAAAKPKTVTPTAPAVPAPASKAPAAPVAPVPPAPASKAPTAPIAPVAAPVNVTTPTPVVTAPAAATIPVAAAPADSVVPDEPAVAPVHHLPQVELTEPIIVKDFASKLGRPVTEVISALVRNGIMATINEQLDYETAAIIAEDLGFHAVLAQPTEEEADSSESDLLQLMQQDDPKRLVRRAPVISVIGHVDHGKTRLLDAIRGTAVMESEAGGITQRIGAYQVQVHGRTLTFLDTPGHEAFTAMRAHGVRLTDIAILVVAADDGVKPQTVEAISHARDAGIHMVVAINKIDKPGADVQRVKAQLAEHDVLVEGWGGSIVCAEISALKGTGIDALLELLLIVADMDELKADPGRSAVGTVIESHLDLNLGPLATVLVHTGTLKLRDAVVIGASSGRVRAMIDYHGTAVDGAGPSFPVRIAGLSEVPQVGDVLHVEASDRAARDRADLVKTSRAHKQKARMGLSELTRKIASHEVKELKLIIKADNKGSLEAIKTSIEKIKSNNVTVRVIHAATGDVSNSDIMLASVSGAVIIGFTVKALPQVLKRAEYDGVDVRLYSIIYKLLEDVEGAMRGLLTLEKKRADIGIAKVLKIFFTGKNEMVIGVEITEGKMQSKCSLDIIRDQTHIGTGVLTDLRLVNESLTELPAGNECGIRFTGPVRLRIGDELEAFVMEEIQLTLEG